MLSDISVICPACGFDKARVTVWPLHCRCGSVVQADGSWTSSVNLVNRTVCPHRGEQVRLVECPSCNGSIKIKVYSCAKHGECTVSKSVAGIHVCDG